MNPIPSSLLNGHYRLLKHLAQGGFGHTFLAIDERFPPHIRELGLCVIKQFSPTGHTNTHQEAASELFTQESLRLIQLGHHSQIPEFLDSFTQDGQQYLVQEWIHGQTLEQELAASGVFHEATIRELLQQVLPVLQFVHDRQVIHRDIKPANLIRRYRDRQLFLVDFGAAKYFTTASREKTGTLIGSPEYASPEQVRGKAVIPSDLYSLGVTCLHLLTQISPFELYDCTEDRWIWYSYLPEPISPSLKYILNKLVQPAIKHRYQSALEVLADLDNLPKFTSISSALHPNFQSNVDNDDETPFFGLNNAESLAYAYGISIAANSDIHAISSVTIFDPQTQAWYHLPANKQKSGRKSGEKSLSTLFLTKIKDRLSKILLILLAEFALISPYFILEGQSHSKTTNLRIFPGQIIQSIFCTNKK
jgi:serine/threonine protein kinase